MSFSKDSSTVYLQYLFLYALHDVCLFIRNYLIYFTLVVTLMVDAQ